MTAHITQFKALVFVGLTVIGVFSSISLSGATTSVDSKLSTWLDDLPAPWTLDESQLDAVLPMFHEQFPEYHQRLIALSYWRLGTPYKIFNLGEEQAPDFDPVFRLDVSDCTSHILTTMALAESKTWNQARQTLINIHYKPNQEGQIIPLYQKRWHYTADRLLHHELTPAVSHLFVDSSTLKSISLTLNKKQDGSEFLKLDWSKDVTVDYIPATAVDAELLQKLPDFIGVAFVKESYFSMGVVMAHEGMIIDREYLLHAGQVAERTVIEDFLSYFVSDGTPRFDGIMLFEIKSLNE